MMLAAFILSLACTLGAQATLSSIDWQSDLVAARKLARERGQPMLVLLRCET